MSSPEQVDLSALRISRKKESGSGSKKRDRRGVYLIIGIVTVILVIIFFNLLSGSAPRVQTASVRMVYPSQINQVLVASGYVVAQRKASVASKATGRLDALLAQEGDRVEKNEIVARLESGDIEAALAQAKANLNVAQAALVQAEAEREEATASFERAKSLIAEGSISRAEFDVVKARYKRIVAAAQSAEAGIRAAEAGVRSVEVQLENTRIRAPFDGTVLTKNADVGEVVAPFGAASNSKGAVLTIADMNSLEVEADVSESNIQKITLNQPCEITLDAFPDARYRGIVHKIVPTVDRAKATVMTKVRFIDRDDRVLPEMSAKVAFLSRAIGDDEEARGPKLGINPSAVLTRDGKKIVFVVQDDILGERTVTLGKSIGTLVEVLDGLTVGERIVLKPRENFTDGMEVDTSSE